MKKIVELKPVKETTQEYEVAEARIKLWLKRELYHPILAAFKMPMGILNDSTRINSALLRAISMGRVTYKDGVFSGQFNGGISRELKTLGAKFDRLRGVFKLPLDQIPYGIRSAFISADTKFRSKISEVDQLIARIVPEEIARNLKLSDVFEQSVWKVEKDFQQSIKNITVAPQLSETAVKSLGIEYETDMQRDIKGWTEESIVRLRKYVQETIFAGNRYDAMIDTIQKDFQVSANKAKFLARQETKLLMTKFKEVRFRDSGVSEYKWHCVVGSKLHPVRPRHKALSDASKNKTKDNPDGKIYRFDDPPITTEPGQPVRYNNPGEDFNCRCVAIPLVRF